MNKPYKYIIFFCLISNFLLAQDTITIFYDKNWSEITNSDNAVFYRKAFLERNKDWTVNDYYISGKVQMIGTYNSKKFRTKQGHFTYFYENGMKSSEGNCVKNKDEGKWTYWYETGQKHSEGEYCSDKCEGIWTYWHENGIKKAEGKFSNNFKTGSWIYWTINGDMDTEEIYSNVHLCSTINYYENGKTKEKGTFNNGQKQREWTHWNVDGRLTLKGSYSKGLPNGEWVYFFSNGKTMNILYKNGVPEGRQFGRIIRNE